MRPAGAGTTLSEAQESGGRNRMSGAGPRRHHASFGAAPSFGLNCLSLMRNLARRSPMR